MSEDVQAPEVVTSFLVVQMLDGQVAVTSDTGIPQLREASSKDAYMMCDFVAKTLAADLFQPAAAVPPSTAQTLQDKLAERRRDAQP